MFKHTENATIKNLGVLGGSINVVGPMNGGYLSYIGGLVGKMDGGSITNCYSTIEINVEIRPMNNNNTSWTNNLFIGGLVGRMSDGSITNCYANNRRVGVYVNFDWGQAQRGGLVGQYYSGTILYSYWNKETLGTFSSGSSDAYGKTSSEMKNRYTYNSGSWFTGSRGWAINPAINNGYPFLRKPTDIAVDYISGDGGSITPEGHQYFLNPADASALATADDDYVFTHWTVDNVDKGSTNPLPSNTLTTNNKTLVARFRFDVSFTASGDGGTIEMGNSTDRRHAPEVLAKAKHGFKFDKWTVYGDIPLVFDATHADIASFIPTGASELRASFVKIFGGGTGSEDDPFQLSTLAHLEALSSSVRDGYDYKDKYLRLMNNIDASATNSTTNDSNNDGKGFLPIGSEEKQFLGTIDGNGYPIRNLYINRETETGVGFIGYAGPNSNIKSIGIVGGSVTGADYVGGLVGQLEGHITSSYANTIVKAIDDAGFAGGLVGGSETREGSINNSYAMGTVSSDGGSAAAVGGLVGFSASTITKSYATGVVTGTSASLGGLVGVSNQSDNLITNCYWDSVSTKQLTSVGNGAVGKPTAEMKTQGTYAGWDFDTNLWRIDPAINKGYPYLAWQGYSVSFVAVAGAGGSIDPSTEQKVIYGEAITSVEAITESGFIFSNWVDVSGAVLGTDALLSGYIPTADLTITANWAEEYSITYNLDGGAATNPTVYTNADEFSLNNPTKDQATFAGWTWEGQETPQKSVSITTTSSGDKVYIANWDAFQYTVNFEATGGYIEGNIDQTVSYGSYNEAVTAIAYTEGLVLEKWTVEGVEVSRSNPLTDYQVMGDATLVAHFATGYMVRYFSTNTAYGTVSLLGEDLATGAATSVVRATANLGARFEEWTVVIGSIPEGTVLDEVELPSFIPTEDISLQAVFIQDAGAGSFEDPFKLSSLADLENLSALVAAGNDYAGSYFSLTQDIDASKTGDATSSSNNNSYGFDPIGSSSAPFNGKINGNRFAVTDLYINRPAEESVGFVGYLGASGTIDSLSIIGGSIKGNRNVGSIVGYSEGDVSYSSATSAVIAFGYNAGGLLGNSKGNISNCFSIGSVSGVNNVGGIVGLFNGATLSNSYSTSAVNGKQNLGGLVGYSAESIDITNSYAIGAVTADPEALGSLGGLVGHSTATVQVTSSYWDQVSTGQASSFGDGLGKSRADMQDFITYDGWDFTDIWLIEAGINGGLPYFKGQVYRVRFLAGAGGTISSTNTDKVILGAQTSASVTATANPGYSFVNWTASSAVGEGIISGASVTQFSPTDNVVFTANFVADEYTIIFDANTGAGTTADQEFTFGIAKALTANRFAKAGHTFTGWSTDANGTVIVGEYSATANITLYAIWTVNTYTMQSGQ